MADPNPSHAKLIAEIARLRAVRIDWAEARHEHVRLLDARRDDIATGATGPLPYPYFESIVDAQLKSKLEA